MLLEAKPYVDKEIDKRYDMQDKIVETLETVLATIFIGFGGLVFVKDILENNEEEETE